MNTGQSAALYTIQSPKAPEVYHAGLRHGRTVVDPFHWMAERSNPALIDYLRSENLYTEQMSAHLEPLVDTLFREIMSHTREDEATALVKRGDFVYYSRFAPGDQHPRHCRRRCDAENSEEVFLDMNELAATHQFAELGGLAISDDQKLLAYLLDNSGARDYRLFLRNLQTTEQWTVALRGARRVVWAPDNQTLFVTLEQSDTKWCNQLWSYSLSRGTLELVFEEQDPRYNLKVTKTRDNAYILAESSSSDSNEIRYIKADAPSGQFRVFLQRAESRRYLIEHREKSFYIYTNRYGKNYSVMRCSEQDIHPDHWTMFVPHRDDVSLDSCEVFQRFAVLQETVSGLRRLRVYDFETSLWCTVSFPASVYTIKTGPSPDYTSKTYRYKYENLITPMRVYDYEVNTRQSTLVKEKDVPGFDPKRYACDRLWARSRDGLRIPVSIVYPSGFPRDGSGALLLTAYGSYGTSCLPLFDADRLPILDRGMAYAIAHVRGGNEMGAGWREGGRLLHKKNSFNDFVDCAEHLIAEGWTSPSRLVIEGRSAGALLIGAVINMRPDLFRAAHLSAPFLDLVNTMMNPSLPFTTHEYLEWGDPANEAHYQYMMSYSPYDNLHIGDYPAVLVTTSFNDGKVMYWEAAKYVARLRRLNPSGTVLLRTRLGAAGHAGFSARYDAMRERAFQRAWMLDQVGLGGS